MRQIRRPWLLPGTSMTAAEAALGHYHRRHQQRDCLGSRRGRPWSLARLQWRQRRNHFRRQRPNGQMTGTRQWNTGMVTRGRIYFGVDNKVHAFTLPTGTPTPTPTATPPVHYACPAATPPVTPTPPATPTPTATPSPMVVLPQVRQARPQLVRGPTPTPRPRGTARPRPTPHPRP
jgi:hypothetical protein